MNVAKMAMIGMMLMMLGLSACSSAVTQAGAEQIAQEFVAKNVKFFSKGDDNGTSSIIEEVSVPTATSYREGSVWVVVIHVSSEVDGIEKKNDLVVKVDSDGNVVEFNGQKLTQA